MKAYERKRRPRGGRRSFNQFLWKIENSLLIPCSPTELADSGQNRGIFNAGLRNSLQNSRFFWENREFRTICSSRVLKKAGIPYHPKTVFD
jgi:hypothetical protein